ncbi:hypothetical protein ARZXY2_1254 [Arthrobacter sp. ZXY-2]|nr:hypothetical protein ARZXY2_1254 [Arthrobacter sp. ZXY-2]
MIIIATLGSATPPRNRDGLAPGPFAFETSTGYKAGTTFRRKPP